jgi:GTP1/Obg family GTP-binding protein
MKQQTAVEFLMDKLFDASFDIERQIEWFDQAKEMENNQIIIAYNRGCIDALKDEMKRGEQYYKETFKKDE